VRSSPDVYSQIFADLIHHGDSRLGTILAGRKRCAPYNTARQHTAAYWRSKWARLEACAGG
jgi:hypothetical protein